MKKLLIFGFVFLIFASFGWGALDDGLEACWSFDDDMVNGTSGAKDLVHTNESRFELTPIDSGEVSTGGASLLASGGESYSFSGAAGGSLYLNESETDGNSSFNFTNKTWSFAFYGQLVSSVGNKMIFGRMNIDPTRNSLNVNVRGVGSDDIRLYTSSDGSSWTSSDDTSDIDWVDGAEHFYVLVFDQSNFSAYINDSSNDMVLISSYAHDDNLYTSLGELVMLGGYQNGVTSGDTWQGLMDEAMFWNRAITKAEIDEINTDKMGCAEVISGVVVPGDSLNISSPLPVASSQFNTQSLNHNLTANASYDFNCSLYINGSLNQTTDNWTFGVNTQVKFNSTFGASEQNTYTYQIRCDDGTIRENTSTITFYIDNVDPVVDAEDINDSHQEVLLTYSINVSDVFLFSFKLNDSCGNNYNNTSISSSPFYFDDPYRIDSCSVGLQHTNISVCDGHSGALNCISETYYWNKTSVVNITVFDVIAGTFINSFTINDSGKNMSTTDGNLSFWQYSIGNYSLTVDIDGYELSSETVGFDNGISTYQFNLYTTNSFNFTFYDEISEEIVNQNITVEFISDVASYNYTAENGTLYVDVITPSIYTLRYYSSSPTDYGLIREYIYELTNRTHQELSLWMIDDSNSTEVTITVYDETTLNLIENAVVYIQRYFIGDNSFKTVAMYSTDVAGKSYFDVEADNQYYKILIDFPWQTRKYTSEKFYFSGTAYNVYVSLLDEVAEDFFDEEGISVNIVYSNTTSKFTATWVDSGAVATEYCLYLKKYGQYSKEILNYSCSTANSGSIELIGFEDDTINYAIFTATINGQEKIISSSWKELVSSKLDSGAFGVFMTAVLVGMFAFMVSFHVISLILGAVALIFSKMMGLIDLGWPYIFGIFFAAIILSLMLRLWKQ